MAAGIGLELYKVMGKMILFWFQTETDSVLFYITLD